MKTALLVLFLAQGALAADQPASMKIGNEILESGGDAVDAVIATALAVGVENPSSSGVGGGGFAIVWRVKERRLFALDFRESAPAGADPDAFLKADGTVDTRLSQLGCLAAGVPGEVAGLAALHTRFGTRPWKELVEPARALAADGVAVSPYLAHYSELMAAKLKELPNAARAYLRSNGSPLRVGDMRTDLELATLLVELAADPRPPRLSITGPSRTASIRRAPVCRVRSLVKTSRHIE